MEAIDRVVLSKDWITGILILSLVCLVFAKSWFYNRFLSFIILPFNNKYVVLYNKKGRLMSGFHLSLSVFQMLNLALYAYLSAVVIFEEDLMQRSFLFPVILGGILLFTLAKIWIQWAGGYIFENQKLITSVVFKKLSYLNFSSLILFTANLLLTYLLPDSKTVVFIAFGLFLLVNIIGWIAILKIHQNYITSHFFYFILYLCALEIAPFLIISNMVKA
jgi:hypothetical protein